MTRKKIKSAQIDLFSQEPERMQWEKLNQTSRRNTQRLLAQLFMSVHSHNQKTQTKEPRHAIENY